MPTSVFDNRLLLSRAPWYGLIVLGALCAGFLLATAPVQLMLILGGLAWLLTLPYHGPLSVYVAVSTFSSALIMPFFPGRPYLWEFAALLGWSGLIIMITMRRYAPNCVVQLKEYRWLFIGAIGYCLTLLATMYYRGVGLRILGGSQMGGRFYFQQLVCAIFPLLFVMVRPEAKVLVRL